LDDAVTIGSKSLSFAMILETVERYVKYIVDARSTVP